MSELSPADQIFYILLIGGMILISVGGILYIIADILERKQELKDINQARLSQSFNKAKGIYEYHSSCYCKRCQANRQNKRRTLNIHLN